MDRYALALAALLAAAAPAGHAQEEHPIDKALGECIDEDSSTAGMIQCIDAANTAWDGELNRRYGELMKRLPDAAKAKLRDAQRRWIAFRDADLEAIGEIYGGFDGTMYRTMANDAVMQLTKTRAEQIGAMLDSAKLSAGEE